METKYEKYYPIIKKSNEKFFYFLEQTKKLSNINEKEEAILSLIEFAVYYNCGIWTSSYIENFYIDWAKKIDLKNYNIKYKKNSFLHVLTKGYNTGGHTRVVERWINNAPENQIHSVVFISPSKDLMNTIEQNVKEKHGECIYFESNLSTEEKALKLRELGMQYEYIILHTHMEEVVSLIAFGSEKFKRPVFLYNHASHLFWMGKSISDLVLDIENNDEVTRIKRNIKNTYFMGVPSKTITYTKPDKIKLRQKLNLPSDKKIIISAGASQKYVKIGNESYAEIINKLIDENTYCYIIGIKKNDKYWKKIKNQSKGHIIPLGYIKFKDGYLDYISSADLYIDSYPFCGGTAVIDAVSSGVPSLSLKSTYPQFDYLTATEAYCLEEAEFINKAKKILNDEYYAQELLNKLQKSLKEYQSTEVWNKRVEKLLDVCPKIHTVKDLSEEKDYEKIDDLSILINILHDKQALNNKSVINKIIKQNFKDFVKYGINYKKIGIPYIIEFCAYKKVNKKTKIIKIFGVKVYSSSK